jgi:type I restriction enzyme R subunit
MSGLTPTEGKFEQYIEAQLQQAGYQSIDHNEYDRNLCLIKSQLITFIRNTQSESWGRLTEIYGVDTENKVPPSS